MHWLISEAISRLTLTWRVLNDDETTELSYHELDAIQTTVNEVYSLLVMANKLYLEREVSAEKQ